MWYQLGLNNDVRDLSRCDVSLDFDTANHGHRNRLDHALVELETEVTALLPLAFEQLRYTHSARHTRDQI